MRPRMYDILGMAVEEGIDYGWARAFKHDDDPADDRIKSEIAQAIMNEVCNYFSFDDETSGYDYTVKVDE